MRLSDIKPDDEIVVFDKLSRKTRKRHGKYIASNSNFLTIQFQHYKDTLLLSDLKQGKAQIFKDTEAVIF
ncbi:MAG TPA: hypothetical protein PK566_08275 [Pseudobacteroides sp.]|jgi:hypothetical protein|nr:hypothetical protein [Pseudobacteroides sp.]